MRERTYRVSGRVQGVGFRWWTRSLAERLAIDGSVRNESDGSVVIRARGSEEAITTLEEHLGHGPPGANVRRLERIPGAVPPTPGFAIEH